MNDSFVEVIDLYFSFCSWD